jgi:hypothetical protein
MKQVSLTLTCAALWSCGSAVCAANLVDWRYCIAPAPARHAVYLTPAFTSSAPMDTIESAFAQELTNARVQYEAVQCPRGDADAIGSMRQHAIEFNEQAGNRVVQLDWAP